MCVCVRNAFIEIQDLCGSAEEFNLYLCSLEWVPYMYMYLALKVAVSTCSFPYLKIRISRIQPADFKSIKAVCPPISIYLPLQNISLCSFKLLNKCVVPFTVPLIYMANYISARSHEFQAFEGGFCTQTNVFWFCN